MGAPRRHERWADRWLPGAATLHSYQRDWLGRDLTAGLALSALLVPQGMAYAELAGLPAVTGLYTSVLALVAYAIFGPSRIMVLGPDSALGPLILAATAPLIIGDDPAEAVALASMLALCMGAICVLIGIAGLGSAAELLSKPVRVGYLNGLALVVAASQLPRLFGFDTDGTGFFDDVTGFVSGVADGRVQAIAAAIGLSAVVFIAVLRRWAPRVPGILLAAVGATVVVAVGGFADDIAVVGQIPGGLPAPRWPSVDASKLGALVLSAVGIAIVTLADSSALSRSLAARRNEEVDPNREIVALGAANLATGLFQGFPVSASSSRTAVATATGARTQLVGVVGALSIVGVLVFAGDLIEDLPTAALAAIVVVASTTLFDSAALRWLWSVRRSELVLSLITTVSVLVVGVLGGIAAAVVLSLANFVRQARRPHDALLGRIDRRKGYHDRRRHPDARAVPGLLTYRFDAPLFFGNADHFRRRVREVLHDETGDIVWFAIAAEPMTDIDTTGAEVLAAVLDELDERDITVVFAELKGPAKDQLDRYGLYERIGASHFFPTIGQMVNAYLAETGIDWVDWTDDETDDHGHPDDTADPSDS